MIFNSYGRLGSTLPSGTKVWHGGLLHNFNAQTCPASEATEPLMVSTSAATGRTSFYRGDTDKLSVEPAYSIRHSDTCEASLGRFDLVFSIEVAEQ